MQSGRWRRRFVRHRLGGSSRALCSNSVRRGGLNGSLHGSDKSISAPGEGLHVARRRGGVSEGFPHLVDGGVQAMIEVDESVGRPKFLAALIASHNVSRAFQEKRQDLNRLALQTEFHPALAKFACVEVELEDSKTRDP